MKYTADEVRRKRRFLHEERKNWSQEMQIVPRLQWSPNCVALACSGRGPKEVWRSKDFICQIFDDKTGAERLSINRTYLAKDGEWLDGITWDELMRVKREVGRGEREAVEIYPPDNAIVNVANIRHLWVLSNRMPFSWNDSI